MPAHHAVLAFVFALVMGLALGAAVYAPGSRKAFARDQAKFAAGGRFNPTKRLVGPHRSYLVNVLGFFAIFLPTALMIMYFARPRI